MSIPSQLDERGMNAGHCRDVTVYLQFYDKPKGPNAMHRGFVRLNRQADVFHFQIVFHAVMAAFAAQTGLLDATKRAQLG